MCKWFFNYHYFHLKFCVFENIKKKKKNPIHTLNMVHTIQCCSAEVKSYLKSKNFKGKWI